MKPSDAKELIAQHDADWEMPDTWWQIETAELSFHVNREVIEELQRAEAVHGIFLNFIDLYGASCLVRVASVEVVFQSTPLSRAKWIVGMPKRNWSADDPEDKPEWDKG